MNSNTLVNKQKQKQINEQINKNVNNEDWLSKVTCKTWVFCAV